MCLHRTWSQSLRGLLPFLLVFSLQSGSIHVVQQIAPFIVFSLSVVTTSSAEGKSEERPSFTRVGCSKSWSGLRMYAILDSMEDLRRKLRDELDGKEKGKRRIAYI